MSPTSTARDNNTTVAVLAGTSSYCYDEVASVARNTLLKGGEVNTRKKGGGGFCPLLSLFPEDESLAVEFTSPKPVIF